MYKRFTAAATVSGLAAALVMAASPANAAPAADTKSVVAKQDQAAASAPAAPFGGTTTNFCARLRVNGQNKSWEMHYDKVDHSFAVWAPGINRTVYCKDPSFNNYDCLAATEGLVFTLIGGGVAWRAALSLAGGGALSAAAIWQSC